MENNNNNNKNKSKKIINKPKKLQERSRENYRYLSEDEKLKKEIMLTIEIEQEKKNIWGIITIKDKLLNHLTSPDEEWNKFLTILKI